VSDPAQIAIRTLSAYPVPARVWHIEWSGGRCEPDTPPASVGVAVSVPTQPSDARHRSLLARVSSSLGPGTDGIDARCVLDLAAAAVPHADHASLSITFGARPVKYLATTDRIPLQIDAIQLELAEGPYMSDADAASRTVHVCDLSRSERWPRFSEAIATLSPVRSLIAVRRPLTGGRSAALNLYADKQAAFCDDDVAVSGVLADLAVTAVERDIALEKAKNLEIALDSARTIGGAIGILMGRERLTRDQAFDRLRATSQRMHRKLRDLADEVVATGALPDD
jgi:hypothetical protein